MVDTAPLPTFNQPSAIPMPQPQPTYPVQNGATQYGPSGGLVNKAAQAQAGVQNGLNMGNQFQQMQRATQNYKEQQAAHGGQNDASAHPLPPPETQTQTGSGTQDFFHSITNSPVAHAIMAGVHAIGSAFTGGSTAPQGGTPAPQQGAIPAQAPPAAAAPAPAPAPASPPAMMNGGVVQGAMSAIQGLADGGPVLDHNGNEIHKLTGWDLAKQAVSEAGEHMFGSGAGARAADAARQSVNGAANQADIESKMGGGVIGRPNHRPMPTGGNGVSDAGIRGIQGFESGGAIPGPAPAAQAGVQNGMDQAQQAQQMGQANTQYAQGQAANGANAAAASPPAQELAHVVESIHQDMLDHTLDDKGVPNKDAGIPNPAQAIATPAAPAQGNVNSAQAAQTAQATQAAQSNPAAQAGQPEESPSSQGKPHSVPFDMWSKWDANIDRAVQLSAQAGQDPGQVRAALEANRNAWVQGHVLRNLASANVALLNGDDKGVEKALKDAYYYLPDGKDLTVAHDANGKLVYQDPINPTRPVMGADGKPTGKTEPNMIPVDAAHIQMLGTAMLDPLQVQNTIMNVRTAQSQIALRQSQAEGAIYTGKGNFLRGQGIEESGRAHLEEVNANNYLHLSEGDRARAQANFLRMRAAESATGEDGKLDPTLMRVGQQAGDAYNNLALGRRTIEPPQLAQTVNGKTVMVDNPNAGKESRDMSQVPTHLMHLTPEQHAANAADAQDIAIANRGAVSPARAADIVSRVQAQRRMTHVDPKTGKTMTDVLIDKSQNTGHVWDRQSNTWINYKLHPDTIGTAHSGAPVSDAELGAAFSNGSSGGSGIPSQDPEANAPDMTSPTDAE